MKKKLLTLAIALTAVIAAALFCQQTAYAADTVTLAMEGTFDYKQAQAVLKEVNKERAKAGVKTLTMDTTLLNASMQRAVELSAYYSHTRPNGTRCFTVLGKNSARTAGENIALGQSDYKAVMNDWMNSPGHRANILNSSYSSMGVGCFSQPDGTIYWVQLFWSNKGNVSTFDQQVKDIGHVQILPSNLRINIKGTLPYAMHPGDTYKIPLIQENTGDRMSECNAGYHAILHPSTFTFTSSDTSALKVSSKGTVTSIGPGTAKISFTTGNGGIKKTYYFNLNSTPAAPVVKGSINSDGQNILTWDPVPGATGYNVYRLMDDQYTSAREFPKFNKDPITITSFFDYTTRPTSNYKYYVVALYNNFESEHSSTVTLDPATCPPSVIVTVNSSTGLADVTWGAVRSAKNYQVWGSTTKNGEYTQLATVGKTVTSYQATDPSLRYFKLKVEYTFLERQPSGTYKAVYSDFSAPASYTTACASPTVSVSSDKTTGRTHLTWKAKTGAAKYEIWSSSEKNGAYTRCGVTTKTSFDPVDAAQGETRYYKVRSMTADGAGAKFGNVVSATPKKPAVKLSAPVVTASNASSSGKVNLTWDKVKGAKSYEVYRATSKNGTYSKMSTTTSTTYTNTSAKAGTTYYYKVKAVSSKSGYANSAFSAVVSRTCDCAAPVVNITTVSYTGKIKLTWSKVDGAKSYAVYRATSKNGTYTKLGTTTSTSYTNTSAKAGSTYYYKVMGLCSKTSYGNSAFSAVKSMTCDCARPMVKATALSGHKVKLTWAKVDGAKSYEVYRATSKNGTYTKVGTTTSASYTNNSLKAGSTYYYKVKAVCRKTSYGNSAYSTIVSVKAR